MHIAAIDDNSDYKHEITLQQLFYQGTAYVVENNDNFQKRVTNAPIFEKFLQYNKRQQNLPVNRLLPR